MKTSIRIATRKSPLALWQANYVKDAINNHHPFVEIELLTMLTRADKLLTTPLNKIGGKRLFVKELEQAIIERQADIAVHSIKDMPAELLNGLDLAVICKRDDPRDVFISNAYACFSELPKESKVGTSSLRRQAQLLALRPDLQIIPLRGNVGTRLKKLDEGEFDAIILAAAGIKRLNLQNRISSYFSIEEILPAAGQGSIGIECRVKDTEVYPYIEHLDCQNTRYEIAAERAFTAQLGGSCQFPIAAFARVAQDNLQLMVLVSDAKGHETLRGQYHGPMEFAEDIGLEAAEDLIAKGALELLAKTLHENA